MPPRSVSARPSLWGSLAAALAAAEIVADVLLPDAGRLAPAVVGVLLLLVAIPLMFAPFVYLKRFGDVPPRRAYFETTRVVDRGPYALVRHPQYLGYSLFVCGFALTSQHPVTAALAPASAFCFYRQAVAEERQCRRDFGQAYEDYAQLVPRFDIVQGIRRFRARRRRSG